MRDASEDKFCILREIEHFILFAVFVQALLLEKRVRYVFLILSGDLTYASHRCWTVYIQEAIFLVAEACRVEYGQSVSHLVTKAGGG